MYGGVTGLFNGRPTTVWWHNNYRDYLFLIDMPFLSMKRPIIPSAACLSYAQYAIETKGAQCKMSERSRISGRIPFFMSIFITKSNNSGIKTILRARVISDFDDFARLMGY